MSTERLGPATREGSLPPGFAEAAPRLEELGYEPIPVRPGGKKPGFDGWQHYLPPAVHIARGRGHWGVGLLARTTPAADIDVRDPGLVGALYDLAMAVLGPAPIRIGQPPKSLLPYSAIAPFPKREAEYALPGEDPEAADYKAHKVEVLADGQQWLCYAVHPSGRPYTWFRGEPLDRPRHELTRINAADVDRYMAAADELMRARGARGLRATGEDRDETSRQAGPVKPLRPATSRSEAERVADALRRIPVDDLGYRDWITVGLALKAALGEAGLPLWLWWSSQHPDNRPEDSLRKWATFKPGRIGAGKIFYLAKLHGG